MAHSVPHSSLELVQRSPTLATALDRLRPILAEIVAKHCNGGTHDLWLQGDGACVLLRPLGITYVERLTRLEAAVADLNERKDVGRVWRHPQSPFKVWIRLVDRASIVKKGARVRILFWLIIVGVFTFLLVVAALPTAS